MNVRVCVTHGRFLYTGERKQHIIKVRVRKKVSIPLKAPEAPLFKYVN